MFLFFAAFLRTQGETTFVNAAQHVMVFDIEPRAAGEERGAKVPRTEV